MKKRRVSPCATDASISGSVPTPRTTAINLDINASRTNAWLLGQPVRVLKQEETPSLGGRMMYAYVNKKRILYLIVTSLQLLQEIRVIPDLVRSLLHGHVIAMFFYIDAI